MEKRLPAINENARRSNVPISTVSRVLYFCSCIGLRTKIMRQQLAKKMNYEPNTTPGTQKAMGKLLAMGAISITHRPGLKINKRIIFINYANLPVAYYSDNPTLSSVEQFPFKQTERLRENLLT